MPARRSWVQQIMGMPISVLARGPASASSEAAGAVASVYAELREIDATFSTYREDSEISLLNRSELTLAACSSLVREVARRCDDARLLTLGLFDARRPDGDWDPSGLVKGWAAERAFRHLKAIDDLDWCLNAGGDVITCNPSGSGFTIGIQDPMDTTRVTTSVVCIDRAVATSGTSARGAHLYDPRNKTAVLGTLASVSVTGPSLERADVLATAAFIASPDWASVISDHDGYEALAISADATLTASAGWPWPQAR